MSAYVPLWVKTNHSFLEGTSFPEELVMAAQEHGLSAIAITDRDGMYGLVRAHVKARDIGMRLIAGAEVTIHANESSDRASRLVLLARGRAGYGALCRMLTLAHARAPKGESKAFIEDVLGAAGDVIALCPDAALLPHLRMAYGRNLYALCTRHRTAEEIAQERKLRERAKTLGVPVVAAVEVLYHDRARRPLQDVATCIRHKTSLAEAGTRIRPNAEHALLSADAMAALFADDPDAVRRTLVIAEECSFDLKDLRYRYPAERIPEGRSDVDWLHELTFQGARERYGSNLPSDVYAQIERELALIGELDYGGYFLTMHEIVQFCRRENILCQGRGSAANSAVCYSLGITAIDPLRMELLFERFLSRERAEPPDIDLDIEHERREEVIQHVYERYDRRHSAMVANLVRYRPRSAVRDVGKALGIPATELDGIARLVGPYDALIDPRRLEGAGVDLRPPTMRHMLTLADAILDFPRHLSIHPGGFLLGHEPVDTLVPVEPATMPGRTVIQWDKYDIEDLGLFKVDLLGLGSLTCIHHCFDLLQRHSGIELQMATVPAEDRTTYEMISRGDTVGVFQIESRAQMAMLPRLRPEQFYDLVIEVAIVRPGPIQGDMVHPYLRRRDKLEPIEYPHPSLEKVLKKTLGVPIFQEQVMKLAVMAAGYSPGEADQLRRDMAGWRRTGLIEGHSERFVSRMVARGIPQEFAEKVFSQIRGFGEYGFPESHAASFALLAYITAWLRCHHPAAFVCAMLNSQPMGFYAPSTLVEDARRHGVTVLPIDVLQSEWDCTLESIEGALAMRMGLRYVKGLSVHDRARIEAAPRPFENVDDFALKTRLRKRSLVALAQAGAFECFDIGRRQSIWRARALANHANDAMSLPTARDTVSFRNLSKNESVAWDYNFAGHSPRGHPMEHLRAMLHARGIPAARDVADMPSKKRLDYVGMVICRQRPATASGVTFFTLEDETGMVNAVVWRQVFEQYANIAQTASPLGITGHLEVANNVTHLIADRLWVPELSESVSATPYSRDFH